MTEPERRTTKRFRMLLHLLPAEFRGDFGPEMEQVFVEQREEAAREGGKMGIWRLWWETAKGIFTTAPREHLSMLRQDSTFALRMMRKNFGFTLAAIIVLGLGIGELAPRQVSRPPKPVLDHFPHDRGIVGWADAAWWSCRRQAPAERRRTDRHDTQPILVVNRPPRRAEKIDVDAVRQTTGPHGDA